jgi:hypothetical protein
MTAYSGNPGTARNSGTYSITGLVPDGNREVTVRLASGQTTTAPIKHNILFAHFSDEPESFTYKSAAAHTINVQTGFRAMPRRQQPVRAKRPVTGKP